MVESGGGTLPKIVFDRANLFDGAGPMQTDMTVVVEGTKITEVVEGPVAASEDDRVIEMSGRTLIPGLITAHLHPELGFATSASRTMGIPNRVEWPIGVLFAQAIRTCSLLLQSGWTGYVGAGCADAIDAQLKLAISLGVMDGPRILASSRNINTTAHDNDVANWWYELGNLGGDVFADGADEMRKAVRTEIKRGAEIIKIFPTGGHGVVNGNTRGFTDDEFAAIIQSAHDLGVMVRGHCVDHDHIIRCIEGGIDVIDHGDEIDEEIIDLMVSHGTFWVPSMKFLKVATSVGLDGNALFARWDAKKDWDNVAKMLPIANEAGVKILVGDDYGSGFFPHSLGVYASELTIYAEEVGISRRDVLRWATRHGAELLNMAGQIGTVEPGALADLVVVNADPTRDISVLEDPSANVSAVMIDGHFIKDLLP